MAKKSSSPWLSIWIHPRNTIRKVVAENPNKNLWLLAIIYGFSSILGAFQSFSLGSQLSTVAIFLIALVFAICWGYVIFSIWGWVILWTGKLFKGAGDFKSVRASFAWSNVPMIVSDIIWIITLAVMGASLFTAQQSGAGPSGGANLAQGPAILLLAFALIKVLMSVWSLVICISALAEVQRFSVLKAIGNLILSAIVVGIVIGVLGFAITSFMGNPAQSAASIFFNH